jgi:hypothetical protein
VNWYLIERPLVDLGVEQVADNALGFVLTAVAMISSKAALCPRGSPDFARTAPPWRAVFHLETAAKLLKLLERFWPPFPNAP